MNKKGSFNPFTVITAIGATIIFIIIYTDKISTAVILPVLGAICISYGIFGMVRINRENKTSGHKANTKMTMPVMQLLLGCFLAVIGMIDILQVNLSQNIWNGLLVVMVVIIAAAAIFSRRR